MKHLVLLAIAFLLLANAQAQSDTLVSKKTGLGLSVKKNNKEQTIKDLGKIFGKDPEANKYFKKGKSIHTVAYILSCAGGAMVGYELGNSIASNRSVNPAVIGAGVVLVAVAIPLSIHAQKNIETAVQTYNGNNRKTTATYFHPDVYLTCSGTSLGIRLDF